VNPDVARFERELAQDSQLVERILPSLPPAPAQPERVIIRSHAVSVDAAICKALALAVVGVEAQIGLIK
jgi:hypothetical protein